MQQPVFPIPGFITGQLVPERCCPEAPARYHFISFPAAVAPALEIHAAAKRGAAITVWKYGFAALGTFVLEQVRMLKGTAHEGAEPYWIRSHFSNPAATIGHLQIQGNEVELVNVFPVIIAGVDFYGVLVKHFGEAQLLLGRVQCDLLEEIVLFVHDTDFF